MEYEIKVVKDYSGETTMLFRTDEDGQVWFIPFDEANTDYQKYLVDTNGGLPLPEETK
jgi:hypothetical protein